PQLFLGYDVEGAGVVYPSVKFSPTDHVSFKLNYAGYWGASEGGGYFNPFSKNDEIWLQTRIQF
ncbi:MAG: hypothetical protein HKP58_09130, partial [Desulfatitalea sp.]|nr:hypothetical protein [Desulfatitalea sp.]NNK00563.1 hypothetical protein [Desulfatitalea sp.]